MEINETSPHLSQILRDWPALRSAHMIIQDLFWITNIGSEKLVLIPSKNILSYADEYSQRLARSHPLLRVLHPHGRIDSDEEDNSNKKDLALIDDSIAVATLPYLLPTKVRKTQVLTHRLKMDMYPAEKPLDEITSDAMGRLEPWILLRGSWGHVDRIQVIADGICATTVASMNEAIRVMIGLHYLQDVQYNKQVKLVMKYLEQSVCGLPRIGYEDYREVVSFSNVIKKRNENLDQ